MTVKISTRRLIPVIVFCLFSPAAISQRDIGNEWIDHDQDYYKIKIVKNGVYRLSYDELAAAGLPVSTLDPAYLQIYFRGKEVPLYVEGQGDGVLNSQDFVEFYGQYNDGALDSVLYFNPKDHPNPYVSIYTDTAAYYLTVGKTPGLRLSEHQTPSVISYAPPAWYISEEVFFWNDTFLDGTPLIPANHFSSADYNEAEGIFSKFIPRGSSRQATFTVSNIVTGAKPPEVEFNVYGKFNEYQSGTPDHNMTVEAGPSGGSLKNIYSESYIGAKRIHKTINLSESDLGPATVVKVSSVGGTLTNLHVIAWIKLRYARSFVFNSATPEDFSFTNESGEPFTHFQIGGPGFASHPAMLLYDLTNGYRTIGMYINDSLSFATPNNTSLSKYYLTAASQISPANISSKINFRGLTPEENYNYLIVTHKKLLSAANEYAAHKETQEIEPGVNFKTLVVTTDELYDQFFYGVHHPAAIQNFAAYMYNFSTVKPEYLLLLGKGWQPDHMEGYYNEDLVPTLGIPSSDVMFTSGIDNGFQGYDADLTPLMATGRISARTETEVRNYLNKLKEFENTTAAMWQKNVIHVGGGVDFGEQERSTNTLKSLENIIEGPYTGCNVKTFTSRSGNTVDTELKELTQRSIEEGAGLLTYYAHGSPNVLGVDIGDLTQLENKGKYPIMYMNGCNVGNIGFQYSLADRYILKADTGAIAWLSHSSTAFEDVLSNQAHKIYSNLANDSTYGTIGKVWQRSIKDLQNLHGNIYYRPLTYHWVLHGDPSVRFPFEKLTDYAIGDEDLYIFPDHVSALDDSFALAVAVSNLGTVNKDSFNISITHTIPNGTVYNYTHRTPFINYKDTIYIYVKREQKKLQGLNIFEITLDSDSAIAELSEGNNQAKLEFYMPGTGVRTLFPSEFNIVPVRTPMLTVQSRDLFDKNAEVLFELDTTPHFNSPFLQQSDLMTGKTLIQWQPQLLPDDTTVYYWRARLNLPEDSGGFWEVRSFTYIKGSPEGWSQSHFPQYSGIQPNDAILDTSTRLFTFLPTGKQLVLTTTPHEYRGLGIATEKGWGYCVNGSSTVYFIEFDKTTGNIVDPDITKSCGSGDIYYREFNLRNLAQRDSFIKYVDLIKNGNYVALVSRGAFQDHENWDEAVYTAFEKIGSKAIRTELNEDSIGFVIAGVKKEDKGELLGESFVYDSTYALSNPPDPLNSPDVAGVEVTLKFWQNTSGSIRSSKIGPATRWLTLYDLFSPLETPDHDEYSLDLIGTTKGGDDTTLISGIKTDSTDISWINADSIRYLQLQANLTDTADRTPPQLKLWQVIYDGIPEGTLVIDEDHYFRSDTVAQGESVEIQVKYTNISSVEMKEVPVRISIQDVHNKIAYKEDLSYPSLKGGESMLITKQISAATLAGSNRLVVFVNPDNAQPEQTLDNNYLRLPFHVTTDQVNPILDVTFNGRHLHNGEIISPNPNIIISLTNDSEVPEPIDTLNFVISLKKPNTYKFERIYFNRNDIEFTPADTPGKWLVHFDPHLEQDGLYELHVQATDASGNRSGIKPYEITFRIIKEQQLSKLLVYPNPISSKAVFAFTLTGETLPDEISLTIYDLKGRIVADLSDVLRKNLHIGSNEFTWNATDQHGAPLRSGSYIYKVIMRNGGNELPEYPYPGDIDTELINGKISIVR